MASNIEGENHIKKLQEKGRMQLTKYKIDAILDRYIKWNLLERSKTFYFNGNVDEAYTTIFRFLSLTSYLSTNKHAINWEKHYREILKNYKCGIELAETWRKEILMKYNKDDDSFIETNIQDTMSNPILNEKILYNCAWLHLKLVEAASKVLIIDTRSRADFSKSRMRYLGGTINILNIPEDDINEGESAASVYKGVGPDLDLYNKRYEFTYVVLLHKDPNARAIEILHNALSKYDKYQYPNLVSLTEGYSDWCDFYPHCVDGIAPPEDTLNVANDVNLENVKYDINFDNDYDEAQSYFKSPIKSHGVPQFDRTKKPIGYKDNKTIEGYAEIDEGKRKREAAKKKEIWTTNKERELDAERALILEEEKEKLESELKGLKVEREAKEKQLLHERNLKEQSAREDLERRRKLKNAVDESLSISYDNQRGFNLGIHSDRESKPSLNSLNQAEVPKFDRGSKPREIIRNPIIGESPGLTGLKNLGNTCYMNSILQCISNNSSLVRYFYESCFCNDINRKQQYQGEIAEKVADVIKALWAGKHRAVACHPLKSAIGSIKPEYKTCEQQDSHEFLTYLMDWLHCDLKKDVPLVIKNDEKSEIEKVWKDFKIKNESVIFTLFYGLQRSTVECLKCAEQSFTYEPFSNLSLIIPDGNNVALSDCLKLYLEGEIISGWRCPKCNVERNAKKTVDLCKLPNILVIHLKRFSFLDVSSRKRTTFVDFPLKNLSLENNDGQLRSYELFGVSNHYGTIEGGHYTAYCKNPLYNRWYKFDDHEVLDLSPSNVTTSAAYILFYSSPDKKQLHS